MGWFTRSSRFWRGPPRCSIAGGVNDVTTVLDDVVVANATTVNFLSGVTPTRLPVLLGQVAVVPTPTAALAVMLGLGGLALIRERRSGA
ncbi:MAG: hypothetical protein MI741_00485 [Rhodospirillales bacterium]|nr:hypothetical protein [Rhodospirillales bacterium]